MAMIIGAGKYVFGEDLPLGKYNLKVVAGEDNMTLFRKDADGEWEETYVYMGLEEDAAKTYYGLSLQRNEYFELEGNLQVEISKCTPLKFD